MWWPHASWHGVFSRGACVIPYRLDEERSVRRQHASFRVDDEFSCGAHRLFDGGLYACDVGQQRSQILVHPSRATKRTF